jgi:HEPN domain-containing protein
MSNRFPDWLRQAEADLRHARNASASSDFDWSCFAAQQAAQKAIKALFLRRGMEAWGHTLTALLGRCRRRGNCRPRWSIAPRSWTNTTSPPATRTVSIPAPRPTSARADAETAIRCAEEILGFCRRQIG